MDSVVCPHCTAKIRLTRKTNPAAPTRPPSSHTDDDAGVTPERRTEIITGGRRLRTKSKPPSTPEANSPDRESVVPQRRFPSPANLTETPEPKFREKLATPPPVSTTPKPNLPDQETEPEKVTQATEPEGASAGPVAYATEVESNLQPEGFVENDLLPPKFLVADIESDENAVILPSATGGTQVVDRTEVTVSHGGQTVKLVASTPEELKRIRLIENLVAVVIAGIMLAIAVWLLL